MNVAAKVTSKGQVTIPKEVRDALGISAGDHIVFKVEDHRALVARTPDLIEMAGTIAVPPSRKGASWSEVVGATRNARSRERP